MKPLKREVDEDIDTQPKGYAPTSEGLLAPLALWLNDKAVSELLINRPKEVFVEKNGELTAHPVPEYDEATLKMLFQLIANENKQTLTPTHPLLSGSLLDGSRVQLVLPPTATYPTLSIRRKVVKDFRLDDYSKINFYQNAKRFDITQSGFQTLPPHEQALINVYEEENWDAFLHLAIEHKKTIVISGGTSSGKTTFLNACLRHVPKLERILTLEDTREIDTPHPNQVNLIATKGEQGLAKVSMQDLVQCALRLRPDRIIVGEIRGKEILDFVAASSTGHEGGLTSIHANNPKIAFMRMAQLYKLNGVPSMTEADILNELKEVIDVIVQVTKTKHGREVQSVYYKHGHLAKASNQTND